MTDRPKHNIIPDPDAPSGCFSYILGAIAFILAMAAIVASLSDAYAWAAVLAVVAIAAFAGLLIKRRGA